MNCTVRIPIEENQVKKRWWAGSIFVFAIHVSFVASLEAQLVFNEILFDPAGVDHGQQVVEFKNVGNQTVNMGAGFWIYWPPARWQFPAGVTVPPGGRVMVHLNRAGTNSAVEFYTGVSGMRSLGAVDSIGLYADQLFADPNALVDFAQWGASGQIGEDVAVSAGEWTEGSFVDVSSAREGASISYDGSGDRAIDWCVDGSPTLGQNNDTCDVSFVQSEVRLNEVGFVEFGPDPPHVAIELRLDGGSPEDLSGRWIALDGEARFEIPAATVMLPGEILVIHFGINGPTSDTNVYTGPEVEWAAGAQGAVSLHASADLTDPTSVLDFVAWGAPSSHQGSAVAAGIWNNNGFVDAASRLPAGSFAVAPVGAVPQFGSTRWLVDNTGTIGEENDTPPRRPIVINEILIDPLGDAGSNGAVELLNLENQELHLTGYSICLETPGAGAAHCFVVDTQFVLDPLGVGVIGWNQSLPNLGGNTVFTGPIEEIHADAGSIALYVGTDNSLARNLVDYVSWGGHDSTQGAQAAAVGAWMAGASVDVSGRSDGSSIAYDGDGDLVSDYALDERPSIGSPNDGRPEQNPFRRADCNDDGVVDISDAIFLVNSLFVGVGVITCEDACDSNSDAVMDVSDPIFTLNFLFRSGFVLLPPVDTCDDEPTPTDLTCTDYTSC